MEKLKGSIVPELILKGTITASKVLNARIYIAKASEHETYSGAYVVRPKSVSQTLETNDKIMSNDVTVTEIPFEEVSNEYGKTVTIGG